MSFQPMESARLLKALSEMTTRVMVFTLAGKVPDRASS